MLLTAVVIATGACSRDPSAAVARAVPTPVDRTARAFVDALRAGNVAGAESLVITDQRGPQTRSELGKLAATVGTATPDSVRVLNFEGFFGRAASRVAVTYELNYRDRWVIARVNVLDSAGSARVFAAQANEVPRAAAAANALTLRGKSAAQYVVALLVVVMPLFMLGTAIQVVRHRLRRRWLWAPAALLGIGKLSLNWTTGAIIGVAPLYVQLMGAGVSRAGGPYLPWVLSVSLPIGAIIAQVRMRRRVAPPIGDTTAPLPQV